MAPKGPRFAARYRRETDDDGDGQDDVDTGPIGKPAVCMVFRVPDEETALNESDIEDAMKVRNDKIATLQDYQLELEQIIRNQNLFVLIRASEQRMQEELESRQLKLPLNDDYDNALCVFTRKLFKKDKFAEKSLDQYPIPSLMQLDIVDNIIRAEPFNDGTGKTAIDPEEDMATGHLEENGYFYMHDYFSQEWLCKEWAEHYFYPQNFDLIRVYFGEKIALYFSFFGFYITMLWLPAILGVMLFITQCMSVSDTGTFDNPYVVVYAIFLPLWAAAFGKLWQKLEKSRQYDWYTADFENEESLLYEFTTHPDTVQNRENPVTGIVEEFWFDEGTWLPPTGRAARILKSYAVILALNFLAVVLTIFSWSVCLPMMSVGDTLVGSLVCGFLFAIQAEMLSQVFEFLLPMLIAQENWSTETEREDATILRSCAFKLVNNYFGICFVAFMSNRVQFLGDYKCPEYQCMPIARVVFGVFLTLHCLFRVAKEQVKPWIRKVIKDYQNNTALKKAANESTKRTPMEEQLKCKKFEGVMDGYETIVFQFGFVAMFGVAFPLTAMLALGLEIIDLRTQAWTLLKNTQRPPYQGASDIGTWQLIVNQISTVAIITNVGLVGLASHSIYYFSPSMTMVDRVWFIAILEHVLFVVKLLIETVITDEAEGARKRFEKREGLKLTALADAGLREGEL